ncbi:MAG TPA: hypothetical protein VIH42_09985 [Thermoguttaceae bacterium]
MTATSRIFVFIVLTVTLFPCSLVAQEDDVADIQSQDLRANNNANMRYLLIGPRAGVNTPEQGYGLLIVLPGGDGSEEFHPFIKRIAKFALPETYLVAQPVAAKWTDKQPIV